MFLFYKKINAFKKKWLSTVSCQLSACAGFSVIELVAVVAIMTLISGITLFSNSRFSGNVTLESLAYEIALTVRQAQFFGVNVRGVGSGASKTFESGYGVYFNINNPTSFKMFADLDKDCVYDAGGAEDLETYDITRGNKIVSLCTNSGCGETLNIVFKRPDPVAYINSPDSCASTGSTASISIGSPNDNIGNKIVDVTQTGQISIRNAD